MNLEVIAQGLTGMVVPSVIVLGTMAIIGFIYFQIRKPKEIIWNARCYQLGDAIKQEILDREGNIVTTVKLSDMRPFKKDKLVRRVMPDGTIVYKLIDLERSTGEVRAEHIESWGKKKHETFVNVLLDGEEATLLKHGYDRSIGDKIYTPMPRERTDMIKTEIKLQKDRLRNKNASWMEALPYIAVGAIVIGLIIITVINKEAITSINELSNQRIKESEDRYYQYIEEERGLASGGTTRTNSNTNAAPVEGG